jgi:hypothetical protein
MTRGGLPHSDISGSKLICSSPELFAACHVLHRLLAPRHSPYTLSSLTIRNSKLTLTDSLHISRSATVPCNTACVVVGKNYRLQNIQLSKIRRGPSPQLRARSLARGARCPGPFVHSLGGCRNTQVANTDNVGPAIGAPLAGSRLRLPQPGPGSALTIGTDAGVQGDSRASPAHR